MGMFLFDFDGNNVLDILTPNRNELALNVNRSFEDLFKGPEITISVPAPFAAAAGKFNDDEYFDLIYSSEDGNTGLIFGNAEHSFPDKHSPQWDIERGAKKIVIGDINNDGLSDAVIVSWFSEKVTVISGSSGKIRVSAFTAGTNPWGVKIRDINKDGRPDIFIVNFGSNDIYVYLSKK